jgi:glycosyltransferase involved in cell wall biosynthesis
LKEPVGMPTTALVVPFHNEVDRLSGVIRALRNQASHEVEIVFVDNGSTDGSGDLVMELEEVASRSWHFFTEERVGKFNAKRD